MENLKQSIQEWLKDPDEKTLKKVHEIIYKKQNLKRTKELLRKQKLIEKKQKELDELKKSIENLQGLTTDLPVKKGRKPRKAIT
jgi:hypothetical protein